MQQKRYLVLFCSVHPSNDLASQGQEDQAVGRDCQRPTGHWGKGVVENGRSFVMIFRGQVDNNPMEILKVCLEQVLCLSS